jgi:hypothetical protein
VFAKKVYGEVEKQLHSFSTKALAGGERSASDHNGFIAARKKDL